MRFTPYVFGNLELAGAENRQPPPAYIKEMWTFFGGFFALTR
jgi:hypothetical protein